MWWSDSFGRGGGARRFPALAAALLVAGLLVALGACGFRPLHLPSGPERLAGSDRLAATQIRPIEGRGGQRLHNLLRDLLNPSGQPARPSYLLKIKLTKSVRELAIQTDETATRANLTLRASYVVRDAGTRSVLFRGRAVSVNGYNILTNLYATKSAEDGALKRGLRDLADSIRLRLSAQFAKPSPAATL